MNNKRADVLLSAHPIDLKLMTKSWHVPSISWLLLHRRFPMEPIVRTHSHILPYTLALSPNGASTTMRMLADALCKSSFSQFYIFVLLSSLVHLAGPFHILSQLPRTLFYPYNPSLTSQVTKLGKPQPFPHGTSPVQILQYSAPELPTWIPSSQERPPTYLSPSMPWSNQLYVDQIHILVTSRGPPRPSCSTRLKPAAGLSTYGNAIFQVNSLLTIKL